MRGHRVPKPEHLHVHTKADLIVTICRQLIPLLDRDTTLEGLQDAEDCTAEALTMHGPKYGERAVLIGKLHSILDDIREGAMKAGVH
jgi:hypothetical protein